jgi:hypothetical protein
MSMLLIPANTILDGLVRDQAADHLNNGVFGNYRPIMTISVELAIA